MKRAHKVMVLVGVVALLVSGCQGGSMRSREVGALSGSALGAGLGAIIGNQVGSSGGGIAIGAALGGLSGAMIGNEFDAQDAARAETDRRISEQDKMLKENQRLIDELRRRGADANESDRGVVINLPDVLFEFDSARLTPEAQRTAAEVASVVSGTTGRRIIIEGHTDSQGTAAYNYRLSEQRARSVGGALVDRGVDRSRLVIRGFGKERPIANNDTPAGRQRNRRVEVIIEN